MRGKPQEPLPKKKFVLRKEVLKVIKIEDLKGVVGGSEEPTDTDGTDVMM